MDLCDIQQIKALLSRHGFHFQVHGAEFSGGGLGALGYCGGIRRLPLPAVCWRWAPASAPHQELSWRAGRVVSVELDRSLLPHPVRDHGRPGKMWRSFQETS